MIKNAFVICAVLMASVAFAETAQVQRSNSGGAGMAAKLNVQKQETEKSMQMAMDADKDAEKAMLDVKNMDKQAQQKTIQMSNSGGSAMARTIQTK